MGSERTLKQAGMREAHIVSWRVGNGKYHTEAFETEEGAQEFVRRHQVRGRIYKGVVMNGLFPQDGERSSFGGGAVELARRHLEDDAETTE